MAARRFLVLGKPARFDFWPTLVTARRHYNEIPKRCPLCSDILSDGLKTCEENHRAVNLARKSIVLVI
jgi:hypothetical protein